MSDIPSAASLEDLFKKDEAHNKTDKIIDKMERQIAKEYRAAVKEMTAKLKEYGEKFDKKDEAMRQKMLDGEITQKQYSEWRVREIATGDRYKAMVDTLAEDMARANDIAKSTINGHMEEVYSMNRNYATYQVEKDSMIDTSYTLYNRRATEELFKNKKSLLPAPRPGTKAWQAAHDKDLKWNQQKINSSLIQGLLQGDSIPDIAKRLINVVGMNKSAAVRNARTMTTSIENKGRDDAYEELREKGIELDTVWMATLDDRTRHSHRLLHGEVRNEETGKYSNELRYPGDPLGDPEEVYNCRCSETSYVKGFPIDIPKWSPKMGDMTFEEWLGVKEEGTSISEDQKPWNIWDHIRENNWTTQDLADNMRYKEFREFTLELKKEASKNGYFNYGRYFSEIKNGTEQNQKITELLERLANQRMIEDRKGFEIIENLKDSKIVSNPLKKLTAPKMFDQFVNDVGGGDLTKGSCVSLSLCFAANEAGYDVRDFRGGASQDFFANWRLCRNIAQMAGVDGAYEVSKTPLNTAMSLLNGMPTEKNNILVVGAHAAVVKKEESGRMLYLELQSPHQNGWFELDKLRIKDRFCAVNKSKYDQDVILMDVEKLSKNKNLPDIVSYINTLEDQQKKGERGRRR